MCGISGVVWREGEQADEGLLRHMADASRRRGPDASGAWSRQNFGLGHRRLKIIDLSEAANQPFLNDAGNVAIAFNGEVYNFQELRGELEREGVAFRTRSDTEVILRSYERWGETAFLRLNGMFAVAICDGRAATPTLYLVRDRFGIKPLFYAQSENRLAFASELKPLLELPWLSREVDPEALARYVKFSHVPCPRSILRDVRQLPPGSWLKCSGGTVEQRRYFDPRSLSEGTSLLGGRECDWLDELEAVLKRVVKRQLVSDVPLGCFLSGGVDSSLLACACSELEPDRPIETFAIGYAEQAFDETPFAAEAARHFKTSHHELKAAPGDFDALVPDLGTAFDQPLADPTALPTLLLARFARERVTVALSGDGGDELFFGYPYQRALVALKGWTAIPARLRQVVTRLAPIGGAKARKTADILEAGDDAALIQNFIGMIGPLRFDRLMALIEGRGRGSEAFLASLMRELAGLPWREKIFQAFLRTFLVDTVLAKTDRAGMACGLESRVPFLDHEMVDFAARLPFEWKLRGTTTKYLLRRLLARKMPGSRLARRPKQGFSVPLRDWLRGPWRRLLEESVEPHRLRREGYFDPHAVQALVGEHLSGRANHSHLLWTLIVFQLWQEKYLS